MLARPIMAARATELFDQIYVSTEDAEIAKIAKQYGAEVIERPPQIAEDRSTVVQVCLHALEMHPEIDLMCCIYATAVLLEPETIAAAYKLLGGEREADFVMGVSEYEYPPVQALKADDNGYLSYMWPEWRGIQSQFHPHLVVSNGTFYWARRQALLQEKTFYGHRLKGFTVPSEQVTDIDTQEDYKKIISRFTTTPT
ncbi:N-acylneuraminate cytidylyltransferase [Methylophilaceae bacterium]|nr:N-acylneuraminate cytidylyltransferase [Methylophilaceae bacterium]